MLEARNISYSYDDDSQALKNVSLKINDGEMVAILGKNGAGKSTLFLHFNGIHEPDDGEILIDGEKLKYNKKALIKCRQKVGIVFQNPDNQIFAPSVEEDVAFGPLNLKLPMDEVQNRVEEALKSSDIIGSFKLAFSIKSSLENISLGVPSPMISPSAMTNILFTYLETKSTS